MSVPFYAVSRLYVIDTLLLREAAFLFCAKTHIAAYTPLLSARKGA